jgi:hypothetical protein
MQVLLTLPGYDLKEQMFKNYRVDIDHPQREELLDLFYMEAAKRERFIYPVLLKTPSITKDLVQLLVKNEISEPYHWDEILEIIEKRNDSDIKELLQKHFNQVQELESKMKLARIISPSDASSDVYPWIITDNKDWDTLKALGGKAIPALEYSLFLAEKTANQIRPEPPYSESDIKVLLSLWYSQIPDKLTAAFMQMKDTNYLKPKIVKFLLQNNPTENTALQEYIKRHNEMITGSVAHYIDELKHIKEHLDYILEDDCPNHSEPRLLCEKIRNDLKSIIDFRTFPNELKLLFKENGWLFSHKFWDGTNLFSVIKSMGGKLSKKVNRALNN